MSRIQQTVVLDLGTSNILISVLSTTDQLISKRIQRYTQIHREYPSSGEKSRWVNARLRLPQFARPAHPNGSFGLSYLLLQFLWAKREKYDRQRRKIQEAEKQAKRYATLQAMAPTNSKTVHQTSLLHIESSLDRLRLLSPTHDQRPQQKGTVSPSPFVYP